MLFPSLSGQEQNSGELRWGQKAALEVQCTGSLRTCFHFFPLLLLFSEGRCQVTGGLNFSL